MEVAAVLAQKGIGVTMVLNDDRIWKRLFPPCLRHAQYINRNSLIVTWRRTTLMKLLIAGARSPLVPVVEDVVAPQTSIAIKFASQMQL